MYSDIHGTTHSFSNTSDVEETTSTPLAGLLWESKILIKNYFPGMLPPSSEQTSQDSVASKEEFHFM